MNERDEALLRDMLDASRRVQSFVAGKSREDLEKDNMLLGFAVVRAIEIIGEAASKVSTDTQHVLSKVRWHEIIGMRNRIVHDYNNVDYNIVWTVATRDLAELRIELEKYLSDNR